MTGARLQAAFDSEDRRFAVMASGDYFALEDLLSDDLHYTHANGLVETKAEFIRKLVADERRYLGTTLFERAGIEKDGFVATFGKLAIVVRGKDGEVEIVQAYTGIYTGADARLFAWASVKL